MATTQNLYLVLLLAALGSLLWSVRKFETGSGRTGFWLFLSACAFGVSPFVVLFLKARGFF